MGKYHLTFYKCSFHNRLFFVLMNSKNKFVFFLLSSSIIEKISTVTKGSGYDASHLTQIIDVDDKFVAEYINISKEEIYTILNLYMENL